MLLGRSVFQSVVDRLQSESQAEDEAMSSALRSGRPRINSDFLFDQHNQDQIGTEDVDPAKAYRDLDWEEDAKSDPISSAKTSRTEPQTTEVFQVAALEPQPITKDYSYLEKTHTSDISKELKLETLKSNDALNNKRRKFARDNHPDLVPDAYRENANLRMTVANQLIDQAIKQLELRSRLGA